jgi:hypothetical protein
MLSDILWIAIVLSVIKHSVMKLSAIMPSVIMLSDIKLSVIMMSDIKLSVIILSVAVLSPVILGFFILCVINLSDEYAACRFPECHSAECVVTKNIFEFIRRKKQLFDDLLSFLAKSLAGIR